LAEPNCPGIDAADAHCFSRALLVALLAPAPLLFYRTAQWVADACGSESVCFFDAGNSGE
ncbi:MAG: hypothetical protein Q7U80_02490, partial [Thiobacillus sp.]|nr:hypothetical protein [Thiobacillus sp.]